MHSALITMQQFILCVNCEYPRPLGLIASQQNPLCCLSPATPGLPTGLTCSRMVNGYGCSRKTPSDFGGMRLLTIIWDILKEGKDTPEFC